MLADKFSYQREVSHRKTKQQIDFETEGNQNFSAKNSHRMLIIKRCQSFSSTISSIQIFRN